MKRGVSLLEILVVIAIFSVIAVVGIAAFSSYRQRIDISSVSENTASYVSEARAKTLSSKNEMQYGVHFETGKVVLFSGATYNSADSTNVVYTLPSTVEISSIALAGAAVDLVFQRLTGETLEYGTVEFRLTRDTSVTRTLSVSAQGAVAIQ